MKDERFANWDIDVEKGVIWSNIKNDYIGTKTDTYIYVTPPNGYNHRGIHQYIWMVGHQSDIPKDYVVHHIDGNKQNNSIYNLELMYCGKHSQLHNIGNKYSLGRKYSEETKKKMSESHKNKTPWNKGIPMREETKEKKYKQIGMFDENNTLLKVYNSGIEAEKDGFSRSHISQCCHCKRKIHKGYIWKFIG